MNGIDMNRSGLADIVGTLTTTAKELETLQEDVNTLYNAFGDSWSDTDPNSKVNVCANNIRNIGLIAGSASGAISGIVVRYEDQLRRL